MAAKLWLFLLAGGYWAAGAGDQARAGGLADIRTVFIILMENHNWSSIQGSAVCPYINQTLLPMASYCQQYYNPPGLHPSEPNYIWLEAGTNFGIRDDSPTNRIASTNHLATLLRNAGISWKTYQESIDGASCPLSNQYPYAVKHNPFVFFTDVSGDAAVCTNHVRPYTEFAADLTNNTVARYNFITPNLTNDMHDAACSGCDSRAQGDYWLSHEIPKILASPAYTNHGAIFIAWDEGGGGSDGPIGMIVLSPLAKGHGYTNAIHYTHSSTLRTMQEIFGVGPLLGDAANATDLSDLFLNLTLSSPQRLADGTFRFTLNNIAPGRTNVIEGSIDLATWSAISTNRVATNTMTFVDLAAPGFPARFYRVRQLP